MIVTIHQPEHLPWLGFFHKMSQADTYVLLDNVQFSKNNFQNRNRVINRKGEIYWLSVPVVMKDHTQKYIKDMCICDKTPWQRKYWGRITECYARHPYFEKYAGELQKIIADTYEHLIDLNIKIINFFCDILNIKPNFIRASELNASGTSSQLLLNICKLLQADTYLSGPDGRNYLDQQLFRDSNIDLTFHEFSHPVYPAPNFQSHLSTLDLIMNHGPESHKYIIQ